MLSAALAASLFEAHGIARDVFQTHSVFACTFQKHRETTAMRHSSTIFGKIAFEFADKRRRKREKAMRFIVARRERTDHMVCH